MSALRPYEPLGTLKPVAQDIWIAGGPVVRFHYLGLRIPFTTRMALLRLADGALWVHSPIALTSALRAEVEALGPVRHLVAPNTLHYAFLPEWQRAFTDAASHGAPGVRERAARSGISLRLDHALGPEPPAAWAGQIDQLLVTGSVVSQAVFLHRASRTLILTDLVENFEPSHVTSRALRLLIRMAGAMHPDGKAPWDMQQTFRGQHRDALRQAVRTMIGWAPERILLAHGRWYDRDGTAELRRAFRWVA